jgi:hypothetical protein
MSIFVVSVLVVAEFLPIAYILDWGVIGVMLVGEGEEGTRSRSRSPSPPPTYAGDDPPWPAA